eukprot:TRINITY_DN103151_c0_g1_i1.p1 TRINITY_DN103151_c0_g1~~TRINITY_DN103151_c0_g1_i1.p1  ORF type:complete len:296 (-),score=43.64 TRINITY_DN103151_c0_g1_i1:237-1124(-)
MSSISRQPFPARALLERLRGDDWPAWASYLPLTLFQISSECKALCAVKAVADSRQHLSTDRVSAKGSTDIDPTIRGRIWELSRQFVGCREVQCALDGCQDRAEKAQLALELRGHVLEAVACPYANHVLQKCINSLRPSDLQFIIDELASFPNAVEQTAMHKYGCRIIQRLLENCPPSQVEGMANELVSKAELLVQHAYGNYVVQSLLQHGTNLIKHRLVRRLVELPLLDVCSNVCGRAVVKAALCEAAEEDVLLLSRSIIETPGHVAHLAREKSPILKFLKGISLNKQRPAVRRV